MRRRTLVHGDSGDTRTSTSTPTRHPRGCGAGRHRSIGPAARQGRRSRLVRYCAQPPFALERLHAFDGPAALTSPDARLLYRLPGPDLQGRTELLLNPLELLERIARFVPPPRVHRHRYHGVLAPNARLRAEVVAFGRPELEARASGEHLPDNSSPLRHVPGEPRRPATPARIRWAQLLARIYDVLPLLCPACGGEMKVLAFLTERAYCT